MCSTLEVLDVILIYNLYLCHCKASCIVVVVLLGFDCIFALYRYLQGYGIATSLLS